MTTSSSSCISDPLDFEQWIVSGNATSMPLCSDVQVQDFSLILTDVPVAIQCNESCVLIRSEPTSVLLLASIVSLWIGMMIGVIGMYFWSRYRTPTRRVSAVAPAEKRTVEPPASVSRIHISEDSFLPMDEESFRPPFSSSNWQDDVETMDGYSISGIDLHQPSVRSIHVSNDTVADAKSLPLVVQRSVKAPPGKLGVALNVTPEGPTVRHIKDQSPMEGLLFVGDVILEINEHVTKHMTTSAIYKILEETRGVQRWMTIQTLDDVNRK